MQPRSHVPIEQEAGIEEVNLTSEANLNSEKLNLSRAAYKEEKHSDLENLDKGNHTIVAETIDQAAGRLEESSCSDGQRRDLRADRILPAEQPVGLDGAQATAAHDLNSSQAVEVKEDFNL